MRLSVRFWMWVGKLMCWIRLVIFATCDILNIKLKLNERLIFLLFQSVKYNVISCFILASDPYQPKNLTYNTTSTSVTVTIWHPSNTVNVDQYVTNITSFPGVHPEHNVSKEVPSAGKYTEVTFIELAAASNYRIDVTSVIYGECSRSARCGYESLQPATVNITTRVAGLLMVQYYLAVEVAYCVSSAWQSKSS